MQRQPFPSSMKGVHPVLTPAALVELQVGMKPGTSELNEVTLPPDNDMMPSEVRRNMPMRMQVLESCGDAIFKLFLIILYDRLVFPMGVACGATLLLYFMPTMTFSCYSIASRIPQGLIAGLSICRPWMVLRGSLGGHRASWG